MARTAFKLRSQGQPFKQIGATQPVQPPQQDPVQPLYSNPSDPQVQQQQAQMQQQRAPLMQLGVILKGVAKGAADIITGGLDRVYGSGKTDTLGGSKAITFAKTKAELAEQALKDKKDTNKPITELVETSDSKVDNTVVKEEEKK